MRESTKILKTLHLKDEVILHYRNQILENKELMIQFADESEFSAMMRQRIKESSLKIKAEWDAYEKECQEVMDILDSISPLSKQILEMFYINGFTADVCCQLLSCTRNQFNYMKDNALAEFERRCSDD